MVSPVPRIRVRRGRPLHLLPCSPPGTVTPPRGRGPLERPICGPQAIGLSALLLFALAPEQIFSVGTVLTFAAVCGIALFSRPIRTLLPARPNGIWSAPPVNLSNT